MKKYIFSITLAAAIITLAGCNKELNVKPAQSIDQLVALQTNSDVQVALVGSYTAFGATNFYGGRMFVMSELLANHNELIWSGTFQGLTQIFNKSIPSNNGFALSTWLAGYTAINNINNVLSALASVTPANKDRVEGEARFLRGAAYFELVKMYAKDFNNGDPKTNAGVPLVLTPTREINADSKVVRASVDAVYLQVIADLTAAEVKLPVTNGFFATKGAAAALLARVYLQKRDYANARDAANRVITSGKYSLTSTYADAFPYNSGQPITNTSEDVFAMQVTLNSGTNDFQTFFSADSRGDITISAEHLKLYEAADTRQNLFYSSGGSTYNGKNDNVYGNVHTIRLAEMYLIRSEANYRLGTIVGDLPLNDLNRIRRRAGLANRVAITNLDQILLERKLELAFEGFNLSDIKRTGLVSGYFTGGAGLAATSAKLVLPIPDREIKVNSNLTQNEGY